MTAVEMADMLTGLGLSVENRLRVAVDGLLDDLKTQVVQNASGRPGPEIITGAYVASIRVERRDDGEVIGGEVGTDAPQGYRLELGFVGVDSLGRHYNQPPFPHWGPAIDMIEPLVDVAVDAALHKGIR